MSNGITRILLLPRKIGFPMKAVGPKPVAVRLDDAFLHAIDQKRMEIAQSSGSIPTRSDIVRMALEEFLSKKPSASKGK
jgi:hypothetical protein